MLHKLDWLNEHFPNYYFQFTLNDYNRSIEPHIPELKKRIETFIWLSERIGKEKLIWRFDPLLLTDKIDVEQLFMKIENIAKQLEGYTEKMVFSFADIENYSKVRNNLKRAAITYTDFTEEKMLQTAKGIAEILQNKNIKAATCSETIDLSSCGIFHNKCIDDELMIKLFPTDIKLMNFLDVKKNEKGTFVRKYSNRKLKDKGQRKECRCIISKDIGNYNTCPALCAYCYANSSDKTVYENYRKILKNN